MVHNNPILQVEESNSSHNERRLLTKQWGSNSQLLKIVLPVKLCFGIHQYSNPNHSHLVHIDSKTQNGGF
jgi:hypothetical protein